MSPTGSDDDAAWAADPAEEHRLLGAVLTAHAGRDTLTGDHLRGALREIDAHIPITIGDVGRPAVPERVDAARRGGLALTVFVPVVPVPVPETAPPVENLELVTGTPPSGTPDPQVPPTPVHRWRRTTRTEP